MKNKLTIETINPLFIGTSIQEHLDNLHDIMIEWLSWDGGSRPTDILNSTTTTYHCIREVLQNLKPIEIEQKLYWKNRRLGLPTTNLEEIDYETKYLKAIEKISELEKTISRLRSKLN